MVAPHRLTSFRWNASKKMQEVPYVKLAHTLPRQLKVYLSGRFWILGVLLVILLALGFVQYKWIDQLTEAQRQRTEANLTAALSNIESDFDIEITRAFVAFQVPVSNLSNAEHYEEWRRHAPYPNLIRGVYITEAGKTGTPPKPVIPDEPLIGSVRWDPELTELRASGGVAVSVGDPIGFQVVSTSRMGAFASPGHEVMVDGNPAFVFPVMPFLPGGASRIAVRGREKDAAFQQRELVRAGPMRPPQWGIVVFDANYIRSTFLPRLVQLYFRNSSESGYDIAVVNRDNEMSAKVVYPSETGSLPTEFARPDGKIYLFQVRLDCFSTSSSFSPTNAVVAVRAAPQRSLAGIDTLSEILARKPEACNYPPPGAGNDNAAWEMLAKYRTGSLDQAVATFRRRNLFLSGTVLLVLALGISMVVFLTERARALAEMQAEFVLGVSHELRTPLTVISVAADNLKRGIVENSEQAHTYGEIIRRQAAELSNMIEEIFAFARMRSEVIRHRSYVTPGEIVKDALVDSDAALREAGMEVELDLAPELPAINVDVRLIKRCVGNLIQNAIKYAASGERIAIRANKARKSLKEAVEISVEDHGPGISADDLPHIFEPFYRGKLGESSRAAGIGLGLTLVKRAVEAHDGTVDVESAKVTRFSIFLPANGDPGMSKTA